MLSCARRASSRLTQRAGSLGISNLSRALFKECRQPLPSGRHALNRYYATPPPQLSTSSASMSNERYHALSDATMDTMLDSLEALLDTLEEGYEVDYASGVLTLSLGDKGTYVINKQPPNKQIWLSSPFSGPKRYDYSETVDDWIYSRDGCLLSGLLDEELTEALGREVRLGLADVSKRVQ